MSHVMFTAKEWGAFLALGPRKTSVVLPKIQNRCFAMPRPRVNFYFPPFLRFPIHLSNLYNDINYHFFRWKGKGN
jgi:hypothetical protein